MAALAEAKGARKQTGKGKQEGAPGSEEDSDIYKIIRMIMQREFDPVRLPARRWLTLLASFVPQLLIRGHMHAVGPQPGASIQHGRAVEQLILGALLLSSCSCSQAWHGSCRGAFKLVCTSSQPIPPGKMHAASGIAVLESDMTHTNHAPAGSVGRLLCCVPCRTAQGTQACRAGTCLHSHCI